MEVIGTYDPIPKTPLDALPTDRKYKDIQLDRARAAYWLGVGAQPSDTAWRLLSMVGLMVPKYRVGMEVGDGNKGGGVKSGLEREGKRDLGEGEEDKGVDQLRQ